jgi:hypothetical protein
VGKGWVSGFFGQISLLGNEKNWKKMHIPVYF